MDVMDRWGEKNGIYQIYPRSFRDSSRDGIGDLPGITEKLDYLKGTPESLGIDAVWISPFYPSPMRDFGYDVSNYKDVDPMFGTLEDFDELIHEAHERDIAVMIDLVPNHTSSDHPWFQEAISSRDNPKRDYYIFKDPKEGSYPNNWLSVFGGSAWDYHEETGQYYLHSFLPEQPDLNWENPEVQQEMADIIRFWFDRGVDGIRVDAIRWMGKDLQLRDDPENANFQFGDDPYHIVRHIHSRFSPELDTYLRILTAVAREYDERIIILEDHIDDLNPVDEQVKRVTGLDPQIAAPFNFQGMHIPFTAEAFGSMVREYQDSLAGQARAFYCLSNHDEMRLASRYGDKQARMMAVMQLTLPGTPVIYYGQEIGMQDGHIEKDQVRDPFELRVPDRGLGRDPERTPMQWSSESMAGFTDGSETWLPVNPNHTSLNVARQQKDETSSLSLYKKLLHLRSTHDALKADSVYQEAIVDDNIFGFWRCGENEWLLTMLNFSDETAGVYVPEGGEVVISAQNYQYESDDQFVGPYDGVVIRYPV